MTYIFELKKLKIPKHLRKNIKLTDKEKEAIRNIYKEGGIGTRKLAAMFGVSRRLIQFIIKPDAYKKHLEKQRQTKHWKAVYNKERHRQRMREYRKRKKELYEKKLLVEN